jgi:hypothetical protein
MVERGEGSSQGLGTETAQDMAQMFQAMAREFVMAITDRGCLFKRFEQLHISPFDGKRDPMECEN